MPAPAKRHSADIAAGIVRCPDSFGRVQAAGLLLCGSPLFGWGRSAAAAASSPAGGSAGDLDVFRLGPLLALGDVELDLLPFLQAAVAAAGDRAEVHEHVRAALDRDEAVAFVAVEPLHSALRHLDLLVVHAAPRHGGALAGCLWPARHGTRGERKPCAWLTA